MTARDISRSHTKPNRLGTFFSWWINELAGMVPAFSGPRKEAADNLLLVLFGDDRVTLFWREASRWRELGRRHKDSEKSEIDALIVGLGSEKYSVIARLPEKSVLRRRLDLPIAAEKELRQILSYQLDSLSPYPPDQVYFSQRILERDYAGKKLVVELFLAPRSEVDSMVEKMRSWALVPDIVDFFDRDELAEPVINLLPNLISPPRQRRLFTSLNKLLLLVNALLGAALVSTLLISKADVEEELKTRVETAKIKADTVIRLRERVEKIEAESSFLRNRKQSQPSVLSLIEELSTILPDDTWLEKVLYKENSVTITGVSKKASVLISEIERSPLFENAAFQASVVQDNRSGGERFQIKAEITGAERHVE